MNSPPKKLRNHPPWAGHPQSWGNHYMYLPYELCTGVPIVYQMKLRCREDNRFAQHHKSIKWRKREVDPGFSFKQCLWEGPGHVHTKDRNWRGEKKGKRKTVDLIRMRARRGKRGSYSKWETNLSFSEVGFVDSSFLHHHFHNYSSPPSLMTFLWVLTSQLWETLLLPLNLTDSFFSFPFPPSSCHLAGCRVI